MLLKQTFYGVVAQAAARKGVSSLLQKQQTVQLTLLVIFWASLSLLNDSFGIKDVLRNMYTNDSLQIEVLRHDPQIFFDGPQLISIFHIFLDWLRFTYFQDFFFLDVVDQLFVAIEESHELELIEYSLLEEIARLDTVDICVACKIIPVVLSKKLQQIFVLLTPLFYILRYSLIELFY